MEKTWKPTTAGILLIISGAVQALSAMGLIIVISTVNTWHFISGIVPPQDIPFVAPLVGTILIILLVMSIIEAVFPIIGGVFALQRRRWGWALAGSIIAILGLFPLGVASLVFVGMSEKEFNK